MHETAELAGFFMAHAVWSVCDGETLIPLVGRLKGGERNLVRFAADRLEEGVAQGMKVLEEGRDSDCAVLVHDGYITVTEGKFDALIVDARSYNEPAFSMKMALPYRPASDPRGFAVHRPKFLGVAPADSDMRAVGEAFFAGVDQHEEGAKVWNNSLDESV